MPPHERNTVDTSRPAARRIALISDVHANLPAFEAVMEDIGAAGADETWCLGDVVGYGAQPNECVALAAERCERCLVGNHDLVALGRLDVSEFSRSAAVAAIWTRERLTADARSFLDGLEPRDENGPVALFHASPRDPVWEYVLSALVAGACMDTMDARVGAIGHSHVALWFHRDGGEVPAQGLAHAGMESDLSVGDWLINPGGVGQPRDGDPRAAWLLLDLDRWTASWRRVDYPIETAARAIERAGLPAALAERLYYGQ